MRIARFSANNQAHFGVIEGDSVFTIKNPFDNWAGEARKEGISYKLQSVKILAPALPSKIVAIGLNYKAHAAEFNKPLPEEPMIFMKPSTSVIGPEDSISYPWHMSRRVDYEGELAIVVGRRARNVLEADAPRYILGYTCINDVTARDLQGKDGQYTRAKGFDTFAPIGPWIETGLDPNNARITTRLNNELKQDTSTQDMIFNVFRVFSFISHVMTLLPGDVIATGTPSGVGKLKPGDVVEITVEGIGTLRNTVAE